MTEKYTLTEEDKKLLPAWSSKWARNILSTKKMDKREKDICARAVTGIYKAANLTPPKHTVFTVSPMTAAFAGSFAAAIWYNFKKNGTKVKLGGLGDGLTVPELEVITATKEAAKECFEPGKVSDVKMIRPDKKKNSAWYHIPIDLRKLDAIFGLGGFGVACCRLFGNLYSGGNQWSSYDCFLTFFSDVIKLDIKAPGYDSWVDLAKHSGPRMVHEEFCIISDRPKSLHIDTQNRPHHVAGAFCEWRDGCSIYSWHGVRVPGSWMEDKGSLTAAVAMSQNNTDLRAAACEMLGWDKVLKDLRAVTIQKDEDEKIGELLECEIPGLGKNRFLRARCGTGKIIVVRVWPDAQTALEANARGYRISEQLLLTMENRT